MKNSVQVYDVCVMNIIYASHSIVHSLAACLKTQELSSKEWS